MRQIPTIRRLGAQCLIVELSVRVSMVETGQISML